MDSSPSHASSMHTNEEEATEEEVDGVHDTMQSTWLRATARYVVPLRAARVRTWRATAAAPAVAPGQRIVAVAGRPEPVLSCVNPGVRGQSHARVLR